jgi:hypothetical protein
MRAGTLVAIVCIIAFARHVWEYSHSSPPAVEAAAQFSGWLMGFGEAAIAFGAGFALTWFRRALGVEHE